MNIESYEQLLYNIWNSTDSDCCRHQSHLRWALCEHRKGRKREKMNCHKSPPSFHSIFFLLLLLFTLLPAITHSSFPMFNASPLLRFFCLHTRTFDLAAWSINEMKCLDNNRNFMTVWLPYWFIWKAFLLYRSIPFLFSCLIKSTETEETEWEVQCGRKKCIRFEPFIPLGFSRYILGKWLEVLLSGMLLVGLRGGGC